jgi:hypothetical protein
MAKQDINGKSWISDLHNWQNCDWWEIAVFENTVLSRIFDPNRQEVT